jgi:iron complex outermembrane recepter protein
MFSVPRLLCLTASAAVVGSVTPVSAQTTDPTEEIIVYGQKGRQTLQDTQASVAVVTTQEIVDKDIQNFRDAFRVMANVIDSDWVDSGFVLRGVNSEGLTPGGSPLASVYIDGAAQTVQGARRGARGLWDVEQLEVYRGPQSTLSGRASLAGAIYIKTKDPTFDWDAAARATMGSDETREAAVAFGGPIVADTLAFRISAEYQTRENDLNYPEYERYSRFDDFNEDKYWQVRGKLLFQPGGGDGLRAVLGYSMAHDSPLYDDVGGPLFGFEYSQRRGDLNFASPYFQEAREADNDNVSLEITLPISDAIGLTSITSWADTFLFIPSINEGTPGEQFVTRARQDQKLITQEVRLNYDSSDALQWVAGVYFSKEDQETNQRRIVPFSGGRTDFFGRQAEFTNAAVFGEATYRFAPQWKVVAGGRFDYTDSELESAASRDFFNPAFTDTGGGASASDSESTFLPKLGLVWDFAPSQSLGGTVQRGFRNGGAAVDLTDLSSYTFEPEYTWTGELSYRSTWGGNLVMNANVFYTDWKDQQVEVQLIPGDFTSQVTLNAGESNLYGAELEANYRIATGFDAFLSIGYLQTKFDEFSSSVGDLSGFPFPEAPEWTVAFGFEYEHTSGFFIGFDGRKVSEYLARDIQNAPPDEVGDYFVGNARFGWRGERWTVTAFSDNVFDEEYFMYREVFGTSDCCGTLGNRRSTGVTVTARY